MALGLLRVTILHGKIDGPSEGRAGTHAGTIATLPDLHKVHRVELTAEHNLAIDYQLLKSFVEKLSFRQPTCREPSTPRPICTSAGMACIAVVETVICPEAVYVTHGLHTAGIVCLAATAGEYGLLAAKDGCSGLQMKAESRRARQRPVQDGVLPPEIRCPDQQPDLVRNQVRPM